MTTTDVLAVGSITLSLTAALLLVTSLPMLFQKMSTIRSDLTSGMDEFKDMSDEAWSRLVAMRVGKTVHKRLTDGGNGRCRNEPVSVCRSRFESEESKEKSTSEFGLRDGLSEF